MEEPSQPASGNTIVDQQFLEKLSKITEENLSDENFGAVDLARKMGLSHSGLHRKLKLLTHQSISRYIREKRLQKALELLKQNHHTVSEIAYLVGFGSITYFDSCFREHYGLSPGEAKLKDNYAPVPVEKTQFQKPEKNTEPELWVKKHQSKIIRYSGWILLVVLAGYVATTLVGTRPETEKTIAILPFTDESPEAGKAYILQGLRSELIGKLHVIHDLTLVSALAAENYDMRSKTTREIGNDLKANFLLTGNAQTIDGVCRIRLQLVEAATGKNLWAQPFEKDIALNNIFEFQEEVALAVARDMGAIVEPTEKRRIQETDKPKNPIAYNYYLKAKAIYEANREPFAVEPNRETRALVEQSLKFDSTWAPTYTLLGWYYFGMSKSKLGYERSAYFDSAVMMANRAIHFDKNHMEAHGMKAVVYTDWGKFEESYAASKVAIQLDPRYARIYHRLGYNSFQMHSNAQAVENYLMAIKLNREPLIFEDYLKSIALSLSSAGFPELAEKYSVILLNQNNDSNYYYVRLVDELYNSGRYMEALEIRRTKLDINNTNPFRNGTYAVYYMNDRNFDEMKRHFNLFLFDLKEANREVPSASVIGYIYLYNGDSANANRHFEESEKILLENIDAGYFAASNGAMHFGLACIYSARGEPVKALEQLRYFKRFEGCHIWVIESLKRSPMLDNIREMPEFKALQAELEGKYLREKEKVRKVLVREGILM
jgi:TolB-like protein/AraC-like DNA-binding protein